MIRKRTKNHEKSTPILIPRTWNSVSPPDGHALDRRGRVGCALDDDRREHRTHRDPAARRGAAAPRRRGALGDPPPQRLAGRARGRRVAGRAPRTSTAPTGEIEVEDGHGTYWWPLGLASAAGALAGLATLRGHALIGAALGARRPPRPRSTSCRRAAACCAASCSGGPLTTSSPRSARPTPSARSSSSPITTPRTRACCFTPRFRRRSSAPFPRCSSAPTRARPDVARGRRPRGRRGRRGRPGAGR